MGTRQPARADEMYALYEAGATAQEVADKFGVSRQRVYQIFQTAGYEANSRPKAHPKRQENKQRILDFIGRYYSKHGVPPSTRDIADGVGIAVGNTHAMIDELIAEGLLYRAADGGARTLMLTAAGRERANYQVEEQVE